MTDKIPPAVAALIEEWERRAAGSEDEDEDIARELAVFGTCARELLEAYGWDL